MKLLHQCVPRVWVATSAAINTARSFHNHALLDGHALLYVNDGGGADFSSPNLSKSAIAGHLRPGRRSTSPSLTKFGAPVSELTAWQPHQIPGRPRFARPRSASSRLGSRTAKRSLVAGEYRCVSSEAPPKA